MVKRPTVQIPNSPGVYLFRDSHGRVLYVGKAKSLRSRVANYFGDSYYLPTRIAAMVETADTLDWLLAGSEVEALMLEYSLIKAHRPRFNVRLIDDKSYPYLAITLNQEWPRPTVMRGRKRKGVRYFGPYAHAYAIRETLDLLLRTFPVRSCSDGKFRQHERLGRPCLYYDIGRCSAPCVGNVDKERYDQLVQELIDFLDGNTEPVLARLDAGMKEASDALEFELAARLRDQLASVKRASEHQQAITDRREDIDVIGISGDSLEIAAVVFHVRGGRMTGQRGWIIDNVAEQSTAELLETIVLELYGDLDAESGDDIPRTVLLPELPAEHDLLGKLLTERRADISDSLVATSGSGSGSTGQGPPALSTTLTSGDPGTANYLPVRKRGGRVRLVVPQRGARRSLLEQVTANAQESFRRHRLKRHSDHGSRAAALNDLQEALGLPEAPLRIECFDISQVQGTNPVASMVVFEDGLAKKSEYRRFAIKHVQGQDDFAMMREALTRRFKAYLRERDSHLTETQDDSSPGSAASPPPEVRKFAYPPGLLIIDGGRGQLNVALSVLTELGLDSQIPAVGLAKRLEELYMPGIADTLLLPRGSEALYLVQRVRDEAHRFAITFHRQKRGKSMLASVLDDIAGLGPVRRKQLIGRFGSLAALSNASLDEVCASGVPTVVATAVYEKLHS